MFQRTAFHEAAKEGYVDVINELLQGGADPNAVDLVSIQYHPHHYHRIVIILITFFPFL